MMSVFKTIFRVGSVPVSASNRACAIHPMNDDQEAIEIVVIHDWDKGHGDRRMDADCMVADADMEEIALYEEGEPRSVDLSHSILNRQHQPYTYEEHTRQMARRVERIERQHTNDDRTTNQSLFYEPEHAAETIRAPSIVLSDRAQIYAAWSIAGTP